MEQATSPKVFISYAWADELSAFAIDQWLRNKGARVLIDRRDFIPGNDIEVEIVRCISDAGKVVCIYSKNSANRPYPELERRITSAMEQQIAQGDTKRHRLLIYFCIDDTPLPTEALPRLAIKAARLDFPSACEELWRSILEKAVPPKELDLSTFQDKAPWKMDAKEQEDALETAWKVMINVQKAQQNGTTLGKWKKETYWELTERFDNLPDELKLSRLIERLKEMVAKDAEWEKRNSREQQAISERELVKSKGATDNPVSMATGSLASIMFGGVLEDNRRLHRIRKEILEDVAIFVSQGRSTEHIIEHIRNSLCG